MSDSLPDAERTLDEIELCMEFGHMKFIDVLRKLKAVREQCERQRAALEWIRSHTGHHGGTTSAVMQELLQKMQVICNAALAPMPPSSASELRHKLPD